MIARESSLETVLELVASAARPLVPRVHDLGVGGDPVDVAQQLGDAWLLASEPLASEVSQHDILGFDPFLELRAWADRAEVELGGGPVLLRIDDQYRGVNTVDPRAATVAVADPSAGTVDMPRRAEKASTETVDLPAPPETVTPQLPEPVPWPVPVARAVVDR